MEEALEAKELQGKASLHELEQGMGLQNNSFVFLTSDDASYVTGEIYGAMYVSVAWSHLE